MVTFTLFLYAVKKTITDIFKILYKDLYHTIANQLQPDQMNDILLMKCSGFHNFKKQLMHYSSKRTVTFI